MSLVVLVLLTALALGRLSGGRVSRLGELELDGRRLVLVALVVQAAGGLLGGPAYPYGLAVSALLVAAFLVRNRGLRGLGLVALGLAANAIVVALNGAMPVSERAAARAGVRDAALDTAADPRHEGEHAGTRLRALGDVVPVPLPGRPEVVSAGDVLVAAGLGQLVVLGMLGSSGSRTAGLCHPGHQRPQRRGGRHGEEGPQEARAQEERRQPRQAPERLTTALQSDEAEPSSTRRAT